MPNMIYYHPTKQDPAYRSGSTLRPQKMKQAFKDSGYEVYSVEGFAKERRKQINEIKKLIKAGIKFDFLYMESVNTPLPLSNRNHWPVHLFLDFSFLYFLKRHGIKTGVFYRDIFWRFNAYKKDVPLYKRIITVPLHLYELFCFTRLADIIFLPSLEMASVLPVKTDMRRIMFLPAGYDETVYPESEINKTNESTVLSLVYIGNIVPPEHDISPVLACAKQCAEESKRINITVNVSGEDYKKASEYYKNRNFDFSKAACINLSHLWGTELKKLCGRYDIGLMLFNKDSYLDISMPIKLFDYIGMGIPVIANKNTAYGNYVEENNIGWSIDDNELYDLINHLLNNPKEIEGKRKNVFKLRVKCTWKERCRYAAEVLSKP